MKTIYETNDDVIAAVVLFWLKEMFYPMVHCLKKDRNFIEPEDPKVALPAYIEAMDETFSEHIEEVKSFTALLTTYLQGRSGKPAETHFFNTNGCDHKILEMAEKAGIKYPLWPQQTMLSISWHNHSVAFFSNAKTKRNSYSSTP